jgi:hypothetical protein
MSRLSSLLPGVTGGPVRPPLRTDSGVCNRRRARALEGPWHSTQYCLKMGWMSRGVDGRATVAAGAGCARTEPPRENAGRADHAPVQRVLKSLLRPNVTPIGSLVQHQPEGQGRGGFTCRAGQRRICPLARPDGGVRPGSDPTGIIAWRADSHSPRLPTGSFRITRPPMPRNAARAGQCAGTPPGGAPDHLPEGAVQRAYFCRRSRVSG